MADLPKSIQDIVNKKQEFIDSNRDKLEANVISMQEELLNKFIENILPELDTKDGQILNTTNNLRLIEKLDALYTDFNNTTQTKVVKTLGQTLLSLNKINTNYFNSIVLNEVTSKRFDSVVKNTNELMAMRIGIDKDGTINKGGFLDSFVTDNALLTELKQSLIQNVTGQQSLAAFKQSIKEKIVGTDKVSGGFEKYYRQFAYDTYQQYDRAYAKTMADEFKLNYAVYQGGLIKESRDFCIAHEAKVFTREEIKDFDKWKLPKDSEEKPAPGEVPNYIAKFPNYNPGLHCGGFGCRHSLTWILKSTAERLRPDLKVSEKIIEEVKKPIKNIDINSFNKYDIYKKDIDLDLTKKRKGKLLSSISNKDFVSLVGDTPIEGMKIKNIDVGMLSPNDMRVLIKTDKYQNVVTISKYGNKLSYDIDHMDVEDNMQGKGAGYKMFANMLSSADKNGFESIDLMAAKGNVNGKEYNGYYTWARFGFDFNTDDQKSRFKSLLKDSGVEKIKDISSLQDLMKTDTGRNFWREKGFAFKGSFNIKKDKQYFNDYINEK